MTWSYRRHTINFFPCQADILVARQPGTGIGSFKRACSINGRHVKCGRWCRGMPGVLSTAVSFA
ncbi:hypothetical protein B0H14DRAFT_3898514 [Mycena olivaceomarginata]|nr:hypothetical protein B0H14DRAFT_3898514 [Mycena olivaceomarginata]